MTRRRWIADEVHGDRAVLTGQNARHLARVLRARVGQEFDIACDHSVRLGKITSVDDDRVEFELGEEAITQPEAEITLLLAIFKFDRLEWAIEKATELGVSKIVPVIAQRTDAHLGTAAVKRIERWRKIAHEAAQQSRRTVEPQIDVAVKLKAALAQIPESTSRVVLAETEKSVMLPDVIVGNSEAPLFLAVGPEGGWTADELELFKKSGWISASLGSTILRAETAAIAALAVARALK
jgi:16S rRNA (uracil1498-N3)-methyltransferase